MGIFGRGKEKKKAEGEEKAEVFQSEQLTDYRQKKDWTGWAVKPRPDLKDPVTGEPIVFPPPPESWKEYGWAVYLAGGVVIDPATGKYIRMERDDTYGYIRFYEPGGKLRGEFRWVLDDKGYMWTKPEDIKERAKVVEDFLIKTSMAHAAGFFLFPHCIGTMLRTAGVPKVPYGRMGVVGVCVDGIEFIDPPLLEDKKR
jgi:hypothetical protein